MDRIELAYWQGIYAAPCNANSTFTISNVPPGTYELVTWDENLIAIFGFNQVTVPPGGGNVDSEMFWLQMVWNARRICIL